MAGIKRTIDIIFSGKDEISKTIKSVNDGFDKLKDFTAPLAGLADSILKIEGALVATGTAFGAFALKSFGDFQDTLLEIKGVTQASGEEFGKFTEIAKKSGVETRFTAKESAIAMLELARAGVKTSDDFNKTLIPTLAFVTASNLETGEATNALLKVLSQFGYSINDISKASDILVTTANSTTTNVKELTDALRFVGPVASQLGIPLESTSAALAVLAKQGFVAEMGGTALRNILLSLVAPTTGAGKLFEKLGVDTNELGIDLTSSKKALESLGIVIEDSNGKLLPFDQVIKNISIGFNKLPTEMDKTGAAALIFGKRGGIQMLSLLKEGQDGIQKYEEIIRNAGGATIRQAQEMESGIGGALRSLNSAIEGFSISIGEKLSIGWQPAITGARDFVRVLVGSIDDDTFTPILDIINTYGVKVSEAFKQIAKNIPEAFEGLNFDDLVDSFDGLLSSARDTLSGLFGDIDLSTAEGLRAALQKIIDAITTLNNVTSGIIEAFKPFFVALGEFITRSGEVESNIAKDFGKILGSAKLIYEAGVVVGTALIAIGDNAKRMSQSFDIVIGSAKAVGNAFQIVFSTALLIVSEFVQKYLQILQIALPDDFLAKIGFPKLKNTLDTAIDEIQHFQNAFTEDIVNQSYDGWAGIRQAIDGATGATIEAEEAAKKYKDGVKDAADTVKEIDWRAVYEESKKSSDAIQSDWESINNEISSPIEKSVAVDADTKKAEASIEKMVVGYRADGSEIIMYVKSDNKSIDDTKKKIDEIAPDKKLEIQTKLDIAQIEADADKFKSLQQTIQTGFEWKAKLNIAEVEANTAILEKTMDNINTIFTTSKDIISDAFSVLTGIDFSSSGAWDVLRLIQSQLKTENSLRQEALNLQKALTLSQIELMNAKRQRIASGQPIALTVSADRLQPNLEMIWFNILEAMQTRINAEGTDALIGL